MKITIDMPEDTLCIYLNYIHGDEKNDLIMSVYSIGYSELKEAEKGKVIEVNSTIPDIVK